MSENGNKANSASVEIQIDLRLSLTDQIDEISLLLFNSLKIY